ncbi:MAG: hypothetical protein AB8G86_08765, partial [Saprospiraceae bacterium]
MKRTIIFILIGIMPFLCQSQEIDNLSSFNNDYSEFSFLKEIIGDKRIVCLGEEDHWYGEYFQLKNKLIKYLVNELGFKVLVFESSGKNSVVTVLNDLELSQRVKLTLNKYWQTESVYELINFIKEKEVISQIGVDVISFDETDSIYINEI